MIPIKGALKVGDKVFWESQSAGSMTQKKGTVIEVIPSHERPYSIDYPNHMIKFDGWSREHESYLVEVPPQGKATKNPAKPKLYWPRVTHLKRIK